MLELDVRMTADGEVVVSHDLHLGRLCGVDARVDQGGVNRSCTSFPFSIIEIKFRIRPFQNVTARVLFEER